MDGIPDFLRRELTPEIKAHLKRITARYAKRVIKNPPKRRRRNAQALGPIFGSKIVVR